MRLTEVAVSTLDIPFRKPLLSGSQRWERRRITLLSLRTDSGLEGLGEFVAPEPGDLGEDQSETLTTVLQGLDLADPVSVEAAIRHIDARPFVGRAARAAVESALVDLRARASGRTVARSLTPRPSSTVAVNALVGILPPMGAAATARQAADQGFRCLKLKGGDEPSGVLRDRVAAVRDAVGPGIALRVDFNGELSATDAGSVLDGLAPFGLEYAEQPIPPSAGVAALARLRQASSVPIAADEAVRDLGATRELLHADAVDAIVLKPARVGGLRQASSIAEMAAEAGVPVTVSTLFETGVGLAGGLHLAATVPGDQAHGLATAALLESDLLRHSLPIVDGNMSVPDGPGLGIELDTGSIERYRVA